MRSYTLNSLNEDSRYTITVKAFNSVGSTMAKVFGDTMTSGRLTNCGEFGTKGVHTGKRACN
jgi:ferredoxin-NADP reductase